MNKMEAVLHYGMTRDDPPAASTLRDMFFATVLAAEDGDEERLRGLGRALHQAYCEALHFEHDEDDEDDELELELLDHKQAEAEYQAAFKKAYCQGLEKTEVPDGSGWWENLPYEPGQYWCASLIRDLGTLMGHYEVAKDKAMAEYFKRSVGRRRRDRARRTAMVAVRRRQLGRRRPIHAGRRLVKSNERHAAYRLAERYGEACIEELRGLVERGTFQYLRRQTRTRTICKAVVGPEDVFFILDKTNNRIVTVLTPEQAREHLA